MAFEWCFPFLRVLWNVTFHHCGTLTQLSQKNVRAFLSAVKLSSLIVCNREKIEVGGKVRKVRKKGVGRGVSPQSVHDNVLSTVVDLNIRALQSEYAD